MGIIIIANAVPLDTDHKIVIICLGEKIHEHMISPEETLYAYKYDDHFKILSAIYV